VCQHTGLGGLLLYKIESIKFSPNGQLLSWAFFGNYQCTKVSKIMGNLCIYFDKKCAGQHFGLFFTYASGHPGLFALEANFKQHEFAPMEKFAPRGELCALNVGFCSPLHSSLGVNTL
jgi:hypothetical protein